MVEQLSHVCYVYLVDIEVLYFENFDLTNIVTPIDVHKLRNMLVESGYNKQKTNFLTEGFKYGFDFGYSGPEKRRDFANNLPFRVGNKVELWNKVMKEVKLKRYAGPFSEVPFQYCIQSPIGLVPKAGNQTRLIFHLSYDFQDYKSFNHYTPEELCKVKYRDLDHAVRNCLTILKDSGENSQIWLGITDLQSAFRVVPGRPDQWKFLLMKAQHPITGTTYFFADKCMPFGAGISCKLYSELSNGLAHILCHYTNTRFKVTNYLDDFLFIETSETRCNHLVRTFIEICEYIGVPIASDKIKWASLQAKFLGVMINGEKDCHYLQVPQDKKNKALHLLQTIIGKRTATVKEIQELTGLLNFLAKIIIPGRLFTRRMYAKMNNKTAKLQQHHHVTLDAEFKSDAMIWTRFLLDAEKWPTTLCRPFRDLSLELQAEEIDLYTDSSANPSLGFGGILGTRWFFGRWEYNFTTKTKPSIQYLELYAVCMAIFIWSDYFANFRLVLHCDNLAVCGMLNNTTSGCKHCMVLLRKLMVKCLHQNTRIWAKHVESSKNGLSDSLSRQQFKRFLKLAEEADKNMQTLPDKLSDELWPVSKIWYDKMY